MTANSFDIKYFDFKIFDVIIGSAHLHRKPIRHLVFSVIEFYDVKRYLDMA